MSDRSVGVGKLQLAHFDNRISPNSCGGVQVNYSKDEVEPCKVKIRFTFGKKSPSPQYRFENGMLVEATSDEKGFEGSWFTAKIIDYLENDKYLVEYLTLMTNDETRPLREEVCSRYLRPYPPHLPATHVKMLDRVDAWYNEGWWEGVISKVLRGFKYIVYFATTNEELVFDLVNLRPRQDWISGKWVLTSKVQSFKDGIERNRFKIKKRRGKHGPPSASTFKRARVVEVCSDKQGYEGSWYTARIVDRVDDDKYIVEYLTLYIDDETARLREEVRSECIRPSPPRLPEAHLRLLDRVDAWYNDGWWTGMISKVLRNGKYVVYFVTTNEELIYDRAILRPHHDWILGKWVLDSKDERICLASRLTSCEPREEGNKMICRSDFPNGTKVEVRNDEDGFLVAWFAAAIVGFTGNNKYLVEYETLKMDNESRFLREEVEASYIRPLAPTIQRMYLYSRLEAVNVWHNEGWWIGYVSQILDDWNYIVYFRTTNEEMVFKHSELRPHQEWVGGQWLSAAKVHLSV